MKKNIPNNYKFCFPNNIREIEYGGKILIISPETANWFVLDNSQQVHFFHLLQVYDLKTSLEKFTGNYIDAKKTVTQIVARNFENTHVQSCISGNIKQLHFYLTNKCNLRCPHCYMYSGEGLDDELTTDEIFSILNNFSSIGGKSVTFSGGEISVRKDILEITEHAHKCGLKIRILTNGTLWNEALIKKVSKVIDSVQISIDGYSEESNSKIRGVGNFSKSLYSISEFIQNGLSTEVAITLPYSAIENDEGRYYVKFCKDLLEKYPSDLFKIKIAEQLIDGRFVHLSEQQKNLYFKYVLNIKSEINGRPSELESFVRAFSKKEIMDNCMYGVFSIDSSGNVFLCSRITSLSPICNIRNTSFNRIYELSKKAQKLSNINNFKPCNTCELKYICGGGCRIEYFPEFSKITDIEKIDMKKISNRVCSYEIKEKFYKLMIDANEKLFR